MHDLIKASSWQLALTGTIAGGYASHFFYLLYRLDPGRMKRMGYEYGSKGERKFVERYGTIATEYEVVDEKGSFNSMSRGRILGSPKCRPGISLHIFTDFLLDKAVFLNLTDMSSFLPPLKEIVEYVPLESEILHAYTKVRQDLKRGMEDKQIGKALLGSFLQFSLSYTDKPYGRSPILSPATGGVVAVIPDLSHLITEGKLLNKEKLLCTHVNKELSEGRNIFIYCEYTRSSESNITIRLKEILEKNCGLEKGEVEILESSYPPAEQREQWIHEKAAQGVKVFITNPRCVKTGLDFLFFCESVAYNYPTIMFYQYSYDLFVMWQASRRHYRLNQTEECRSYYILSDQTIQIDALELVASKQVATSAIQGQFSSEGLCAMAQGIDPRIKLVQAVSEKSPEQKKGLKGMFDVLNQMHKGTEKKQEYTLMPTFAELTGLDAATEETVPGMIRTNFGEQVDLFAMLFSGVPKEGLDEERKEGAAEPEERIEEKGGYADMNVTTASEPVKKEAVQNNLFSSFFIGTQSDKDFIKVFTKKKKKEAAKPNMLKDLFFK